MAALGSCLDARAQGGQWLVRMEDLDRPREVRGAASAILRTLETFGFAWDGAVLRQRTRSQAYAEALERLRAGDLLYPCACSRREIAEAGRLGPEGPVYPGTCRKGIPPDRYARSYRVRVDSKPTLFQDRIQGPICQDLARDVGDFVLKRADGIYAYQLAVVVDDAAQGITQVVRGADLILSTPRQMLLQRLLGLPTPSYAHLPLVVDEQGRKLSKSCAAAPVDPADPVSALLRAWEFLGQERFPETPASPTEFWVHAVPAWEAARVPPVRHRALSDMGRARSEGRGDQPVTMA